jgi:hypothetical protein
MDYQNGSSSTQVELAEELINAIQEVREAVFDIRERFTATRKSLYTVEEFAAVVGRAPYTIRRWIKTGCLRAERVMGTGPRGRLLIPGEEIKRLIRSGKGAGISELLAAASDR